MLFHLFRSSLISFLSVLKFSATDSINVFKCIPKCVIFFAVIVHGIVFLLLISSCLLLVYRNGIDFYIFI